jgi:hypothetical protein
MSIIIKKGSFHITSVKILSLKVAATLTRNVTINI